VLAVVSRSEKGNPLYRRIKLFSECVIECQAQLRIFNTRVVFGSINSPRIQFRDNLMIVSREERYVFIKNFCGQCCLYEIQTI
jgi:hypothetical protein